MIFKVYGDKMIIKGDCIEEMKKLEDNSVDAIVTDPPYLLEFMSKEWDKEKVNIDDKRFCSWFVGFFDGEGNLDIHRQLRNGKEYFYCRAEITLRADDAGVLYMIQQRLGGKVYHQEIKDNNPKARLEFVAKKECRMLVKIFEHYPLQAKKKMDFEIWKQALKITVDNHQHPKPELIKPLWEKLRSGRKFCGVVKDAEIFDYSKEFHYLWATECLRVLKPGGFLLSFGGTRTYHRLACGIEDAGFEIRDCIQWLYGSGFPKSLNIGKQIDKRKDWQSLPRLQIKIKEARNKLEISQSECARRIELIGEEESLGGGGFMWFETGMRMPTKEHYKKLKDILNLDSECDKIFEEAEREIIREDIRIRGSDSWESDGKGMLGKGEQDFSITAPSTDLAKQWEGWGTALKPANEPIVVARKPLSEKNVALNVLKWGTGGINIDACRIGNETRKYKAGLTNNDRLNDDGWDKIGNPNMEVEAQGRFPANIILECTCDKTEQGQEKISGGFGAMDIGMSDTGKGKTQNYDKTKSKSKESKFMIHTNPNCPCYMLDEQSGESKSTTDKSKHKDKEGKSWFTGNQIERTQRGDKGGASRFFYCAKASKSERNYGMEINQEKNKRPIGEAFGEGNAITDFTETKGNRHPTVKPIRLMEYLIKLVSREGATILDPFLGSGTTAIACQKLNRKWIGIEKEEEYIKIAKARIKPYLEQQTLFNDKESK